MRTRPRSMSNLPSRCQLSRLHQHPSGTTVTIQRATIPMSNNVPVAGERCLRAHNSAPGCASGGALSESRGTSVRRIFPTIRLTRLARMISWSGTVLCAWAMLLTIAVRAAVKNCISASSVLPMLMGLMDNWLQVFSRADAVLLGSDRRPPHQTRAVR